MILIVTENEDEITNNVIDWLIFFKKPYIRINSGDSIKIINVTISSKITIFQFSIEPHKIVYNINQFKSIWFRKGNIKLDLKYSVNASGVYKKINSHLLLEAEYLKRFFIAQLESIPNKIGNYLSKVNKLNNLILADQCGLLIPETKIICSGKLLNKPYVQNKYVSKAISNGIGIRHLGIKIVGYTSSIKKHKYRNELFPSLIQRRINKIIDIRVFYLEKKLWCSAIYSQNDPKTRIDYRKYNDLKPNRVEPIELPKTLKSKIRKFMDKASLNCGSLDFILSTNGKYFFLEVNPYGQFGSVGYESGYDLPKEIACALIK